VTKKNIHNNGSVSNSKIKWDLNRFDKSKTFVKKENVKNLTKQKKVSKESCEKESAS